MNVQRTHPNSDLVEVPDLEKQVPPVIGDFVGELLKESPSVWSSYEMGQQIQGHDDEKKR